MKYWIAAAVLGLCVVAILYGGWRDIWWMVAIFAVLIGGAFLINWYITKDR